MLRLIPAPMASSPQPGVGFSFALAPAPNASMSISASAGTSRIPSMVANDQPAGPITPVRRFPESTMGMFHGRAMDDGEPSMRMFKCRTCGAIIMEGKRNEHTASCLEVRKELEMVRQGLSLKLTGKKAQKGGLKRNGSEITAVSPSPSLESPRKGPKRPKIEIAESVASNEEYGVGDISERITLSNGKLETKKARDKRMVEHRRMLKEQEKLAKDQEKLMPSPVQLPKGPPIKDKKEYDPEKHCGVINPDGTTCVRKLDCKKHSVQCKRDIPGRSAPFDTLVRLNRGETQPSSAVDGPSDQLGNLPNDPDTVGSISNNGSNVASGSTAPPAKPKKGRKKHAAARRSAGGNAEQQGPGAMDHDALVQAIRMHNRFNAQTSRNRMYGTAIIAPIDDAKAGKAAAQDGPAGSTGAAGGNRDTAAGQTQPGQEQYPMPIMPDTTQGPKSKAKPPGTTKGLMRFQTFAGGATSGHWHGDRRRMMAAENTMNEIFKQMKRHHVELEEQKQNENQVPIQA